MSSTNHIILLLKFVLHVCLFSKIHLLQNYVYPTFKPIKGLQLHLINKSPVLFTWKHCFPHDKTPLPPFPHIIENTNIRFVNVNSIWKQARDKVLNVGVRRLWRRRWRQRLHFDNGINWLKRQFYATKSFVPFLRRKLRTVTATPVSETIGWRPQPRKNRNSCICL